MRKMILLALALASPTVASAQFSGFTKTYGAPNFAGSQVSIGTAAVQVAAARNTRPRVTLSIGAANNCAVDGKPTVTLATGARLQPVAGATITLETAAPVYMVCDNTTVVSVFEPY